MQSIWTDRRTQDRFAVNIVTASAVLVSATLILYGGLHPGAFTRGVYFFAFYLSGYVSDFFFLVSVRPPKRVLTSSTFTEQSFVRGSGQQFLVGERTPCAGRAGAKYRPRQHERCVQPPSQADKVVSPFAERNRSVHPLQSQATHSTLGCVFVQRGWLSGEMTQKRLTLSFALLQFQVVFFKASYAPQFQQGSSLVIAFCPLLVLFTCIARYLQVRDQRRSNVEAVSPELGLVDSDDSETKKDAEQDLENRAGSAAYTCG